MTLTATAILSFCAILSFLSFRNSFFGLKLIAGSSWFVLMMYMKDNPPGSITEGSPVHVGLLVLCIGFGLMIVLAGLGRGIKTQNSVSINGSMHTVESEGFHLPDWMKKLSVDDIEREEKLKETNASLDAYRATLRNAYRRKSR